ncbi:hypothetical protein [Gordonia malaquae]|uniref:hypothetical protein n=1 Tax=Gordonia malaquae TaxID=410332 RepID=UPI0030FE9E90
MSEFAFEASAWQIRAQVAGSAAVDLDGLSRALSKVARHNYFGVGCEEGEEVYRKLQTLISTATADLHARASDARSLKVKSLTGSAELVDADQFNGPQYRGGSTS